MLRPPWLADITRRGDAREESFYPTLIKALLEQAAAALGKGSIHVTVLPKRTEAGNPDFRLWDGQQQIVGYIEARTPATNLERQRACLFSLNSGVVCTRSATDVCSTAEFGMRCRLCQLLYRVELV